MRKITFLLVAVAATIFSGNIFAETTEIVKWSFSGCPGGTGNYGSSPFAPTSSNENLTVGNLTRNWTCGSGGSGAANAWGGNNFTASSFETAVTANEFVTFTLTANTGYILSLASTGRYNVRRSSTGPTTGQWQYALGAAPFVNIGTNITWGTVTAKEGNLQSALDLSGITELQNLVAGTVVTFRLVVWGASGTGGTFYFNDNADATGGVNGLAINGSVDAESASAKVADPEITFTDISVARRFAITCATPDAAIYYTYGTQGENGYYELYNAAAGNEWLYDISSNQTVYAFASKDGMDNSDTINATSAYPQVATPVISPNGGDFGAPVEITITCAQQGGAINIFYTTNGATPNAMNGTPYTGPFTLSSSATLKAMANCPNCDPPLFTSDVAQATFTVPVPEVADIAAFKALANGAEAKITGSVTVVHQVAHTAHPIFGGQTGELYVQDASGWLQIKGNTMKTYQNGDQISGVTGKVKEEGGTMFAAGYKILEPSVTPLPDAIAGATPDATDIASANLDLNGVHRYVSFTGATVESDIVFDAFDTGASASVSVGGTTYGIRNGFKLSANYAQGYVLNIKGIVKKTSGMISIYYVDVISMEVVTTPEQVATPVISPAAGTYDAAQTITISCTTEGAAIYYTTNGDEPTTESNLYSEGGFTLSASATVKAIAVKDYLLDSEVAEAAYVLAVATPVISPAAGTYDAAQTITISCTTEGAAIYYTTNGDAPTAESNLYSEGGFTLSASATVKAIAVKEGFTESEVAEAAYVINVGSGLDKISENAVEMFVANGKLNIISEGGQNIEIFNVVGQTVANLISKEGITTISNLSANQMLIVKIGNKTGKVVIR
ncbi:MAG: chitobiase/beta-hexosaminidase C-terminal domain-containing protein [Bacteroidales bacterium]|nr:chitobiase/beta-hexosaminidase C-terminal domain-containing protein [Bacteroidales bacterium]